MNFRWVIFVTLIYGSYRVHAYEGPKPLRNIKIGVVSSVSSSGLFTYKYSVSNPKTNDGSIYSIDLFLSQDPNLDSPASSLTLKQCSHYGKTSSTDALKAKPGTAVGASSPTGWDCGYGTLRGFADVSYGWGAEDTPYLIHPGTSRSGFSLTSYGLPAIREILISPNLELENLPREYDENAEKTMALEDKIQWLGKTVGPKFPPKVFVASNFLEYLVGLKDQSVALGWLDNKAKEKKLDQLLTKARGELGECETTDLKQTINQIVEELSESRCSGLADEAHALLYFNAKYFLAHLPKPGLKNERKCKKSHQHRDSYNHDRDYGHDDHDHNNRNGRDRDGRKDGKDSKSHYGR